jgi:hypothetical protein
MCCSSARQSHAFDEGIVAWRVISKQIQLRPHTAPEGKREKALFRIFLTVQLRKMGHSADNLFFQKKN